MTRLAFLVVLAVPLVVAGSNQFPGACPQVTPVADFQLTKFAEGKWLLVQTTDDDNDRCVAVEYILTPTNSMKTTGKESDGDVISENHPFTTSTAGVLKVTEKDGDEESYTVLAVDYEKYAVVFKCDFDAKDQHHDEDVFVYVRAGQHDNCTAEVSAAKSSLSSKGIQVTVFYNVGQANCA